MLLHTATTMAATGAPACCNRGAASTVAGAAARGAVVLPPPHGCLLLSPSWIPFLSVHRGFYYDNDMRWCCHPAAVLLRMPYSAAMSSGRLAGGGRTPLATVLQAVGRQCYRPSAVVLSSMTRGATVGMWLCYDEVRHC